MTMEAEPVKEKPAPGSITSSRLVSILLVGGLFVVLAGWGLSVVNNYADPANQDPTPLPRKKLNAPYIKSKDEIVNKMIEMAQITDKDLVYDLGCGDGKIVIAAALERGCRGVGFDIDPERIKEARENARMQGADQLVTFEQQDVFKVDLTKADVIVMYLLPWMLKDLIPQIDRCRPGVRIVSNDFSIEGVEVEKTELVETAEDGTHRVQYYITPLKKLPEKPKWKPRR